MRSGGNDLGGEQIGGLNIKEYLQPRTAGWGKVVFAGQKREADPLYSWPSNNTPIAAKGVWNGCCGPPTSISLRGDWAG